MAGWFKSMGVLACVLVVAGCTDKAKVIEVSAAKFKAETDAAYNSLQALQIQQVVPPASDAKTPQQQDDALIKAADCKPDAQTCSEISLTSYKDFIDQIAGVAVEDRTAPIRQAFDERRAVVSAFASTFDNLEQGALLATPAVEKSVAPLNKILASLATTCKVGTASITTDTPAQAAVYAQLNKAVLLPMDAQARDAQLRAAIAEARRLVAEQKTAVELSLHNCAEAMQTGMMLKTHLSNYGTLSLNDLLQGLEQGFALANTVPGVNTAQLEARTKSIIGELEADPDIKFAIKALQTDGAESTPTTN